MQDECDRERLHATLVETDLWRAFKPREKYCKENAHLLQSLPSIFFLFEKKKEREPFHPNPRQTTVFCGTKVESTSR